MARKSSTVNSGINKKPTKLKGGKNVAASKPTIKKRAQKQIVPKALSIEQELIQRNFELQIINSVQAALAAELNIQGIYDAVGDNIREITGSEIVMIQIWDIEMGVRHDEYSFEKGKRFPISEHPFTPLEKSIIPDLQSGKTIVWNEGMKERIGKLSHSHVVVGVLPLSVVFVPLKTGKANQKVITAISLQNSHEHAFSDSDVRLIETLANAMSVALQNARLFDETQRLLKVTEDRAAELAIINSVQAGLASKLEMQAIYDLVGNKIQEIFDAQIVIIGVQNRDRIAHFPFAINQGQRVQLDPIGLEPIGEYLMNFRQPLLVNMERDGEKYGQPNGAKSFLAVPMFVGKEFRGAISLQNADRENAFSNSDVRLLSTLSSSMSVALENARLFDETQRLLKITEERAAELAIINSVSEGLVRELDFSAIIDLVGEKIRQEFKVEDMYIGLYDSKGNTLSTPYYIEHGDRYPIEPFGLRPGYAGWTISNRATLVINENIEQRKSEMGMDAGVLIGDDQEEPNSKRCLRPHLVFRAGDRGHYPVCQRDKRLF